MSGSLDARELHATSQAYSLLVASSARKSRFPYAGPSTSIACRVSDSCATTPPRCDFRSPSAPTVATLVSVITLGMAMTISISNRQTREDSSLQELLKELRSKRVQAKLVGTEGGEIPIPESVFELLRQITEHLAEGKTVSVVAVDRELTTNQAADFLNVSRPFLMTLLKKGEIPFTKVGKHHRIRFEDLRAYKERRDAQRRTVLDELVREAEAGGFYEA